MINPKVIELLDLAMGSPTAEQMRHHVTKARYLVKVLNLIETHTFDGLLAINESGRDCDGVEYSGKVHYIEATIEALEALHDEIYEWADGPFKLDIVPFDAKIEYTSRDLVMEAFEDGHPSRIVSKFP